MGSLHHPPLLLLPPRAPVPPTLPLSPHWPVGPPCAGCGFCGWGGVGFVVCLPLLPPSPFSASPLDCLRSAFFVVPVPWLLRIGPLATEPGFGHYVGRPPAFQELTGPRWPGPTPQASPSPLVGEVRSRRLLSRLNPLLRPLPRRLVLHRGGGVSSSGLGFRPRTNGVRGCSGGGHLSPSGLGPAPFPSPLPARCAPGAHTAREVPSVCWWCRGWGPPVHACHALG